VIAYLRRSEEGKMHSLRKRFRELSYGEECEEGGGGIGQMTPKKNESRVNLIEMCEKTSATNE